MNFFDYCFYRISRFYKKRKETDYTLYGGAILGVPIYSFILTIIVLSTHGATKSRTLFGIIGTVSVVFCVLFFNEKRYLKLDESYNPDEDKNRKRKGWLVALFVVGLFFIALLSALYVNLTNRGIIERLF